MQVSINNLDGRGFVTADHYLQESEKRGEQNSMPGVSNCAFYAMSEKHLAGGLEWMVGHSR